MKFISAFILLIALILQTAGRFVVVMKYELNKEYIARNICENRDKPTLGCHGKCYLKKQLAKADKEENVPNSKTGKDKNEQLFAGNPKGTLHFLIATELESNYPLHSNDHTPDEQQQAVFHPPQV